MLLQLLQVEADVAGQFSDMRKILGIELEYTELNLL